MKYNQDNAVTNSPPLFKLSCLVNEIEKLLPPSKLINHYSLSKTVMEFQRSMHKYGIHEVFTVVKPFDIDGPDAGRLKNDNNGSIAN